MQEKRARSDAAAGPAPATQGAPKRRHASDGPTLDAPSDDFAAPASSASSASAPASCTADMIEAVQRVRAAADAYAVLELSREAAEDDAAVQRAYKRHALRTHPDKNSAPFAEEAFKIVGEAFAALRDAASRAAHREACAAAAREERAALRNALAAVSAAKLRRGLTAFFSAGGAGVHLRSAFFACLDRDKPDKEDEDDDEEQEDEEEESDAAAARSLFSTLFGGPGPYDFEVEDEEEDDEELERAQQAFSSVGSLLPLSKARRALAGRLGHMFPSLARNKVLAAVLFERARGIFNSGSPPAGLDALQGVQAVLGLKAALKRGTDLRSLRGCGPEAARAVDAVMSANGWKV